MIIKKINIPKLLEELKGLPVSKIRSESANIYDDKGNIIDTSMSIHPEIKINAALEEIDKIWQVINDHIYENDYREKRYGEYNRIGEQLDNIYHDIENGVFGNNAINGDFYNNNKTVKDKYPKTGEIENE